MKKVFVVTGGGQGIGKAIVRELLIQRHTVFIAELDEVAGQETAAEYTKLGDVQSIRTDTGDEGDVSHLVETIRTSRGRLDGLVNNAGIADPEAGPIERLSLAAWEKVIRINMTGYFLCAKYCCPLLRESKGAIINIASTRALQSEPHTEPYSASKGGVVALTHALAVSLGPEIRVNCISPGWIDVSAWKRSDRRLQPTLRTIDHEQHPAGRVGRPEDIAGLVVYLCSDQAGFITGQNFVVDGGMTIKMSYAE